MDPSPKKPEFATFGAGQLAVGALVVWRGSPWRIVTVLYRENGTVSLHDHWNEPLTFTGGDLDTEWAYLAERVLDGSGGNGYTYELGGFEVSAVAEIDDVLASFVTETQTAQPLNDHTHATETQSRPATTRFAHDEHHDAEDSDKRKSTKTPRYVLSRTGANVEIARRMEQHPGDAHEEFGEQAEWGAAIPWLYRALASPRASEPMMTPPVIDDDTFIACAYWTPLVHLLLYSFGWSRPDLGLKWWYDAGKPTDDQRFALIDQMWLEDGQLDWFAAFLWSDSHMPCDPLEAIAKTRTTVQRGVGDQNWVERCGRSAAASRIPNPLSGGSDPLHLSDHCAGPVQRSIASTMLLQSARSQRKAVLTVDGMTGWYQALIDCRDALPDVGERSWHVDVFVKTVGWLGTYRRSRDTGLWFAGPHNLHIRGNP